MGRMADRAARGAPSSGETRSYGGLCHLRSYGPLRRRFGTAPYVDCRRTAQMGRRYTRGYRDLPRCDCRFISRRKQGQTPDQRSEEHTSEPPVTNAHLVCRLLLEKKKKKHTYVIKTNTHSNN